MSKYDSFGDEMKPFDDYKRFNVLAFVAILFAPLTFFGFLHVGFSFLGIIGILLGILSIRLAQSEEYKNSGKIVGYTALAISAIISSASYTYHTSKLARFHRIAHQYSLDYIDLIMNGEFAKAHEMTMAFEQRPSAPEVKKPDLPPGFAPEQENLISNEELIEALPKKHPFKELIADAGKGELEYLGPEKWFPQQNGDWFLERFEFRPKDPNAEVYVFDVILSRDRVPGFGIQWRMRNFDIVKGTDNPVLMPGQRPN